MINQIPIVIAENNNSQTPARAVATAVPTSHHHNNHNGLPPRRRQPNHNCITAFFQRQWTPERIAHCCSNFFIFLGCLTALAFAIYAVKDVTSEYTLLTVFIIGGTFFGGACLLALVNVSWLSRRPGVRVSAIQGICNLVLGLITAYLEILFWPFPAVAYSILFGAALPMLVFINLPSFFPKAHYLESGHLFLDGETVCLEEDGSIDDDDVGSTGDVEEPPNKEAEKGDTDNSDVDTDVTQQTVDSDEGEEADDIESGVLYARNNVESSLEDGEGDRAELEVKVTPEQQKEADYQQLVLSRQRLDSMKDRLQAQVEAIAALEEKQQQGDSDYQQLLESRQRLDSMKERVQELENKDQS